jgi:protein-S-isoprenylcysteine O-methyltransferase Ste14
MVSYNNRDKILRRVSSYRGLAFIPPFIYMIISSHTEIVDDHIVWLLGIVIILFGFGIRLWATKHIGRRMLWMKKKGKQLMRTGPYTYVRNPLYIANIVIAVGLSILSESFWLVPFSTLYFFLLYHFVVLYEENRLLKKWGDEYQAYRDEVPRWIPRFEIFYGTRDNGFKWIHSFKAELPSLYVTLSVIFIFALRDLIIDQGMGNWFFN